MAKDLPVGRVGCVVDGDGLGRLIDDAKSEVRCNECRRWFDGRSLGCTHCGAVRPGRSKAIRTAQLNRALYEQAGLRPKSGDFRV